MHLGDVAQVARWAREFPEGARKLAAAFWPGPLTLILPRAAHVGDAVTGGQDSVGLRMPAHPVAKALLAAFAALGGAGIAAPSANRFGHVSPTSAQHVEDDLGNAVAMILDGGPCAVGIESTIVAFTSGNPVLLRPGGIGVGELARVLGRAPEAPGMDAPRASGTLASHYAPTRLRIASPPGTCCTKSPDARRRASAWPCSRATSRAPPPLPDCGLQHPATRFATRTISTPTCVRSTRRASRRY